MTNDSHAAIKARTLSGAGGKVVPSARTMQREHGQPVYSSLPGPPSAKTDPAFSSPIAPGPDEGRPIKSGPAWNAGRRAGTQVQSRGTNKMDGPNIGRGRVITY